MTRTLLRRIFNSTPSRLKLLGKCVFVLLFMFFVYSQLQCNLLESESESVFVFSDVSSTHPQPNWSESAFDIFADNVPPTHPQVLKYIADFHLHPPSREQYRLGYISPPLHDIKNAVENKRNGFFIECGANDGIFLSNTLGLEAFFNWTGLLVESSPSLFEKLKTKHRNAWISNACLSGKIEKIDFLKSKKTDHDWRIGNGKINPEGRYAKPLKEYFQNEEFKREDYISEGIVECFPLHSILLTLNVTTVDFFSLDVEGHEYKILQSIPFDKIDIKVVFVEHWLAPEGKTAIQDLMMKNGFALLLQSESDFIFKKM